MNRSVLVVDDEADVRALAMMSLERVGGYRVCVRPRRAPSASMNSPTNCRTSWSWT